MKKKPYLTQYCNILLEWHSKDIQIDSVSEAELAEAEALRQKALAESGLTDTELSLICVCRKYGIFKKVNTYAHTIKHVF